jgi:restriction system protein
MTIPDYQSLMLPLLQFLADKKEHSFREALDALAKEFNLSEAELRELLPSGTQPIFDNKVGWARTYIKKAGLMESTRRGAFRITERGLKVLSQKPPAINVKFLKQFPQFIEFQTVKHEKTEEQKEMEEEKEKNPEELLENAYQQINDQLVSELLKQIKAMPAALFEKVVVDLLVAMGYGGTLRDAGQAIGKSGDEGIDGVIKEDRLGLDAIYLQAKKWENNVVGRPEIQKFAGALQGQRARKGIFITTSNFSKEAYDYISRIDTKIVLIDGEQLARLMIDHNIGVTSIIKYEIKKMDSDYFSEENLA